MPRSGSGTYTLPSGNPVVTGTTIESNWANTTLSDIATTLTDSLSRSGQGGMTAALRIADGTQGAPGLGFANETGSGLYRAGTGEVWAVVQGAQTMNLDANGVTVPSDKATSIEGTFVFNETGADKDARFEGDTDANLLFTDASTDRVGIGTATPATKLDVVGDVTVSGAVNAATVNATTLDMTNIEVTNIKAKDGTAAATITDATGVVNFAADVGVGASTPTFGSGSGVEIQRAGIATLRLENSSASNSFELYADSAANGINLRGRDSSPMNFWTANTSKMTLDSAGNLGLGVTPSAWFQTSSPYKAMQFGITGSVFGRTGNEQINVASNAYATASGAFAYIASGNAASMYQQNAGTHNWFNAASGTAGAAITFTQAMTLDASGNLGIGTISPASAYSGAARVAMVSATSTNAASLRVSSANASAELYSAGSVTEWGLYSASNSPFSIWTNNNKNLTLDSSGNLGLGVTPSAWNSDYKNFAIGTGGEFFGRVSTTEVGYGSNYYRNAAGNFIYLTTAAASYQAQVGGVHYWFNAPSGTAGNAITFTQAMTLTAAGSLQVGSTSGSSPAILAYKNDATDPAILARQDGTAPIQVWQSPGTERARITSGGDLLVGRTTGIAGERLFIEKDLNAAYLARFNNANSASPFGLFVNYSAAAPNGTSNQFLRCDDNAATRAEIRSNGGIANYSGNNVNLSDRREKTNFAPAKSYLDVICAIPVQTFNYIDQNVEEDPGTTLGVVAQDVQAVAPEFVHESNWGTEDNPKMRLSIYQTDLQYALMKCIQEQQALINDLRARVAALEAA